MLTYDVPRIVVAAPGSGQGKTTVATALMAAFRARGLTVSGHKVGPDYIDPGYHALATGRPGRNLDPHLQGEHRVAPLFLRGALTPDRSDVAVVEGVMGLFDGATGREGFASTAHVAQLIDAPVLLVVDAAAAGRSVAATVLGFTTFDLGVRIGGVVLNRVGSQRHETEVRDAVAATGVPVLGVLRRESSIAVPARHLGLVPADERRTAADDVIVHLAALAHRCLDLGDILALARSAPRITASPWDPNTEIASTTPVGTEPADIGAAAAGVVAMAGGRAFTFRYTETAELLEAAGATVAEFDPATDESLPAGTSALYLGGGFPEVHAEDLSANEPMRRAIAAHAARGGPVMAECAGLLYLCRTLDGRRMAGVLDADAVMTERLTLGYRTARTLDGALLDDPGATIPGHEFHRTAVTPGHGATPAWRIDGDRLEGWTRPGRLHASYLHVHWAGAPQAARRFAAAAREAAANGATTAVGA